MTNLTKLNAEPPAPIEDMGLEGWESSDLILPQLRIRQPTSDVDEVAEGKFYNVLTNESWDRVYAIFLKSAWGRMYFDRDTGELICKSVNRSEPAPSIENPPAAVCAVCPHSKWHEDTPPKCREILNNILLVSSELPEPFDLSTFSPYLMTIGGTSLKPIRAFVSSLIARKKPIYSVVVELSLEKRTGKVGKFYVLKTIVHDIIPPEAMDSIKEAILTYAKSPEVIDASTRVEKTEGKEADVEEADVDF